MQGPTPYPLPQLHNVFAHLHNRFITAKCKTCRTHTHMHTPTQIHTHTHTHTHAHTHAHTHTHTLSHTHTDAVRAFDRLVESMSVSPKKTAPARIRSLAWLLAPEQSHLWPLLNLASVTVRYFTGVHACVRTLVHLCLHACVSVRERVRECVCVCKCVCVQGKVRFHRYTCLWGASEQKLGKSL